MLAIQVVVDAFKHFHAAIRRARPKPFGARHECSGTADVKPIYIFAGRDGLNDPLCIDVRGQGQLHQDAMNFWVLVQGFDLEEQLCFTQRVWVFL